MTYSSIAFQATHLVQRVYDKLGQTKGIIATGGGATTVIDTTLSTSYQDNDLLGYTAFVAYDAAGTGVDPEGKWARVSAYVASTTTLTIATVTTAITAGDHILLARGSQYPLADVLRICSNALRDLADFPDVDVTITTASNQTEHSVPTGVDWNTIIKLEIQGDDNDANDNQYTVIPASMWSVLPPATAGGSATLIIPQYPSGYTIRVTWMAQHPPIRVYDDPISPAIHPSLAVSACALACAEWKGPAGEEIYPKLLREYDKALARHPLTRFVRQYSGMPHWNNGVVEDGVPDPIS